MLSSTNQKGEKKGQLQDNCQRRQSQDNHKTKITRQKAQDKKHKTKTTKITRQSQDKAITRQDNLNRNQTGNTLARGHHTILG
jgi:hypothetical protein